MKKAAVFLGLLGSLILASASFLSICIFVLTCTAGATDESSALLLVAAGLIMAGSILTNTSKRIYEEYYR